MLAILIDGPANGRVLQVRPDLWDLVVMESDTTALWRDTPPMGTVRTVRYWRHPALEAQPPGVITPFLYHPPIQPNR